MLSFGGAGLLQNLLYAPSLLLLYVGFRLSLRTFSPGEHRDDRAPILYLRSFADDVRSSLQPTG